MPFFEVHTASKGELTKLNLDKCRVCGRVYLSDQNAARIRRSPGWYDKLDLEQKSPGDGGLDIVIRTRGMFNGNKTCPTCRPQN